MLDPRGTPSSPRQPRVHVVIPTHTTRHLDACLVSLAWQLRPPETVVVACDTDDSSIPTLLERWWPQVTAGCRSTAPRLLVTQRPHQGQARLNQTRNNGLRALDRSVRPGDADMVVFLDGDSLLAPDAILRHADFGQMGFELIIPYRINLDPGRTAALGAERLLEAAMDSTDPLAGLATSEEQAALVDRHRRYLRHLRLRQTLLPGVPKAHKPKILGGHHAASVRCLRSVNGYDEQYVGYGYDDDDLARRLHALTPPPRTAIAVCEIIAFHLWHPTRAPARPTDAPGYTRFAKPGLPVVAEHGWKGPVAQPEPSVREMPGRRPAMASA